MLLAKQKCSEMEQGRKAADIKDPSQREVELT